MRYAGLVLTCAGFLVALASMSPAAAKPGKVTAVASAVHAIEHGIDTYTRSIDAADTKLGSTVFATSPDTFFIDPRGTERGWSEIASIFYNKTMGESFTKRTLRLDGAPRIHVYGNTAVAEFEWKFEAVRRDNAELLHSQGRESQTWIRFPSKGWRIVAVHYSGPPVTGAGRGF